MERDQPMIRGPYLREADAKRRDSYSQQSREWPKLGRLSPTRRGSLLGLILGLVQLCACVVLVIRVIRSGSHGLDSIGERSDHDVPLTQLWGQYSPFYSVFSNISTDVPPDCAISFVQILSRHGSRYPTASRSASYSETIARIKLRAKSFSAEYSFLADYDYSLGADDLTPSGEKEMFDSGVTFYTRYRRLAARVTPFIRASGEGRVLVSAQNFSQGYHDAKTRDKISDSYPYNVLVIGEMEGTNNTLNHGLCTKFESEPLSLSGRQAQAVWAAKYARLIRDRINRNLPGANVTLLDTINLMDLCPFETVASSTGALSPFCRLFGHEEWLKYDYFQDLGKYYGFGSGNPLGPTQGVGFVNELIARLTNSPVHDHTTVNHTLDSSPTTFPLGLPMYADFSHDNDMTTVFFALRLYDSMPEYGEKSPKKANLEEQYSASRTVPFAGRAYIEKMTCDDAESELVRVIVNDRVVPLSGCEADEMGRCSVEKFVKTLSFARRGGDWETCFDPIGDDARSSRQWA